MKKIVVGFFLLISLCSCSYVKYATVQAEYDRLQKADPGQINLKHMLTRETHFVIGQTIDRNAEYANFPLAIVAYSNKFKPHERVDTMYFAAAGTHFGLNLPEGNYELLVFADLDKNQTFESAEVIGQQQILVNSTTSPDKVLDRIDIHLSSSRSVKWVTSISKPDTDSPQSSLFYPMGSIRGLDDPLFAQNIATLGMYDPASFLEQSPNMFYALEEDISYKIPVVFVHGIGGSILDFETVLAKLDRERYKPWFFYYPSGGDLNQLAEFFHRLFLSGNVIRLGEMPLIIVAHSMGGIIVREALNLYDVNKDKNTVKLLVTIASPFGGHPSAAMGEKHGLIVLPSWRDLNPSSPFIKGLFRKPLPEAIEHQLFYAFDNPSTLKLSKNSDGVVPLSSQLRFEAQQQSTKQLGFESSHTGILKNKNMLTRMFERMSQVQNLYPESHIKVFRQGGYDVALSDDYSALAQYVIHSAGKYWMAISNGTLKPAYPEQERFVRVIKGLEAPKHQVVKDWLRFLKEYPDLGRD